MAIATLESREDDIDQITIGLRQMRRSAADLTPGRELDISRALPVYRPPVGTRDAIFDLLSVRLAAWRYLIIAPDSVEPSLTADLEPIPGHANALVSISQADESWLDCLRMAEATSTDSDYELRVVEIPEADAAALWLHGEDEKCIDLLSDRESVPLPATTYVASINLRLEARRARAASGPLRGVPR